MAIDREETLKKAEKLYRQGRLEAAIAEYQRVVDEHPRDWTTANTLGDLFYRAQQPDKATEQFTRIADHFAQEGFFPKAAALYKKVLKIRPDHEHALTQAAEMAVRQGVLIEAKGFLGSLAEIRRTRGDARGAAEVLLRIGTLDPEDLEARLAAARAAANAGIGDLVVSELRAVADAYETAGKTDAALEVLGDAARLAPGDAQIKGRLGRAWALRGDTARAREHAVTAGDFREYADLLALQGEEDGALELMADVLRLDPGDTITAGRLVQAHASRGETDRAREFLAFLGDPDDPTLLLLAGELWATGGDLERARAAFARALAREPHRTEALVERGVAVAETNQDAGFACVESAAEALVARGEYGAAAAAYQRFVRVRSDHLSAMQRLVEICVDGGLESEMQVAQAELADAYLAAGRGAEARVLAEDLVGRLPDARGHVERLRRALALCGETDVERLVAERIAAASAPAASLDLTDEPADDTAAAARVPSSAATLRPETRAADAHAQGPRDQDPFKLGPIAIDLSDILGEDAPATPPDSSTDEEDVEIDLSGALDDLQKPKRLRRARASRTEPDTLDEVFKEFRDEVSRESQADAAEQRYKLALAYRETGMLDEAIKELEVAARAPRLRFEAAVALGRLLVQRGDHGAAIEWFERAAEAPAPTVDAGRELLYDLARTLEQVGEAARALAVLLELQADAPGYRDVADKVARLSRVQTGG